MSQNSFVPKIDLQQSFFMEKRLYRLTHNGVDKFVSRAEGESQELIPYEQISHRQQVKYRQNSLNLLFLRVGYRLLPLFLLLTLFGALNWGWLASMILYNGVLFFFYRYFKRHYLAIELYNGSFLYFFSENRKEDLERFLKLMYEKRDHYLRKKYFFVNRDNTLESEKQKLEWLHSERIITAEEFEESMFELEFGFKL